MAFFVVALGLAGCEKEHERVIASGKIVSVTLWDRPMSTVGENEGFPAPKDSRVEVYPDLIIVTTSDGLRRVSPNGFYTNLVFTPD
jgi:hypothetical protein